MYQKKSTLYHIISSNYYENEQIANHALTAKIGPGPIIWSGYSFCENYINDSNLTLSSNSHAQRSMQSIIGREYSTCCSCPAPKTNSPRISSILMHSDRPIGRDCNRLQQMLIWKNMSLQYLIYFIRIDQYHHKTCIEVG